MLYHVKTHIFQIITTPSADYQLQEYNDDVNVHFIIFLVFLNTCISEYDNVFRD